MKFKMKETTVKVRGEDIRVRELTHAERHEWVKLAQEDRFRGPALLVSFGTIEPKVTEAEAGDWPAEVVTALTDEIMALSGMKREKEPDARGAIPVPANSGDEAASKSAG